MNRIVNIAFIAICLIVLLISCGRRTLPDPYDASKSDLPAIRQVTVRFQGSDLVFRWHAVQEPIAHYRLHRWRTNPDCAVCEDQLLNRITLDPKFNSGYSSQYPEVSEKNPGIFHQNGDWIIWRIQPAFFGGNKFRQGDSFSIDYIDINDKVSQPGGKLIPLRPLVIPVPSISLIKLLDYSSGENTQQPDFIAGQLFEWQTSGEKSRALVDEKTIPNNHFLLLDPHQIKSNGDTVIVSKNVSNYSSGSECYRTGGEFVLILNWSLHQESILHKVQRDGTISEEIVYYDLNLYRVKKDSSTDQLVLVNSEPLRDGSFSLINYFDLLYARHQDRYGNESDVVLVFDGVY